MHSLDSPEIHNNIDRYERDDSKQQNILYAENVEMWYSELALSLSCDVASLLLRFSDYEFPLKHVSRSKFHSNILLPAFLFVCSYLSHSMCVKRLSSFIRQSALLRLVIRECLFYSLSRTFEFFNSQCTHWITTVLLLHDSYKAHMLNALKFQWTTLVTFESFIRLDLGAVCFE